MSSLDLEFMGASCPNNMLESASGIRCQLAVLNASTGTISYIEFDPIGTDPDFITRTITPQIDIPASYVATIELFD